MPSQKTVTDEMRLQLLRKILGEITQFFHGDSPTLNLLPYLPSAVFDSLGRPTTNIEEVIDRCRQKKAVGEALDKAIVGVERDWKRVTPETKARIVEYFKEAEWSSHFLARFPLTKDDLGALEIRWEVADVLYQEALERAAKECREWGIDIKTGKYVRPERRDFDFRRAVEECGRILLDLLRQKAELDIAVVLLGAKSAKFKHIPRISSRLKDEYLWLLGQQFRKPLEEVVSELSFYGRKPTGHESLKVVMTIQGVLEPFLAAGEQLLSQLATLQPSPKIYDRVKRMIGDRVMNITITGDGNVVGHGNKVITVINKKLESSRSRELAEAFAMLKAEILESTPCDEKVKKRAVRAVEDAEDEAADTSGDAKTIETSLSRAKSVLEESGEVFDQAKGWGLRLAELAKVLGPAIPGAWKWLTQLL